MEEIRLKDEPLFTMNVAAHNWRVWMPKGGQFCITYEHLTWWQRMGFRFLGWGVERIKGDNE